MDDPTEEVLDPDVKYRLPGGEIITVREMNWKESKQFLRGLASRAAEFITVGPSGDTTVDTKKLMGVIATDLGETLISSATGLTQEQVDGLSTRDVVGLLQYAVQLNVRPEMIDAGKAIAGRFTALIPKKV